MNATALLLIIALLTATLAPAAADELPPMRRAEVDDAGTLRWTDDGSEVRLFGANYCLPSASDYRAAKRVTDDLKAVIDADMAHFARMGFDGLRLSFWGDYENSDAEGNLIDNEHLDLLDYLIFRARERGIHMMFSPIVLHDARWPDAMDKPSTGFANRFEKSEMGRDPAAVAAQARYLEQILRHVNRYTGVALADEPAIFAVELVNEPWQHSRDADGSVWYIDSLADAARSAGFEGPLMFNVSQDFGMAPHVRRSKAAGVTFGWYPTGLMGGRQLQGNFLRTADAYPDLLRPSLRGMPRVVYEFDQGDSMSAVMYPAMVRTFRSTGAQFAAMFSYDMLATAPYNLGWQTHYLNLVCTPQKAVSAVIAGEAMRRLPAYEDYGRYPANTTFGEFSLDPNADVSVLAADDVYMNAGPTQTPAPRPGALTRVVGFGASPVVDYAGQGSYFLDKLADGVWRLEVYPDALIVADPFAPPRVDRVVSRLAYRERPMTVRLPGLGESFHARPLAGDGKAAVADGGTFSVAPGVYLLSEQPDPDAASLPERVGNIGLAEYHAPAAQTLPPTVVFDISAEAAADFALSLAALVVDAQRPRGVTFTLRQRADGPAREFPTTTDDGYHYAARIPADALRPGPAELAAVVTLADGRTMTFRADRPQMQVVPADSPLTLFGGAADADDLILGSTLQRSDDRDAQDAAVRLETAAGERPPEDATAALPVGRTIAQRPAETLGRAASLSLRVRGPAAGQALHVTLVESDGTAWTARVPTTTAWDDVTLPLSQFKPGRAAVLPRAYPGTWNSWIDPAQGRGGDGDSPRLKHVEQLQLSLRPEQPDVGVPAGGPRGVDVAFVRVEFRPR